MKKTLLFLIAIVGNLTAMATTPLRPMLEQGKTWVYTYHHFEERETPDPDAGFSGYYDQTRWKSYYSLIGDTVIDGRQYMKMYRRDDKNPNQKYFGALREDDEGRVYMYNYGGDQQDFLLLDFSLHYDDNLFPDATPIVETVNVGGIMLRRYRYQNIALISSMPGISTAR